MNLILYALTLAYASIGIISAIAYWPTLKDLYLHKKPSANSTSYAIWTTTSTIALLYGLFILKDLPFQFVASVNFIACSLILIQSMRLKKFHNL